MHQTFKFSVFQCTGAHVQTAHISITKENFDILVNIISACVDDVISLLMQATLNGAKSMKGTAYWMAPEVILQTGHSL